MSLASHTPGRNDACHCGSGKKYKRCHLQADRAEAAGRAKKERRRQERLAEMGRPTDDVIREMVKEMTGRNLPTDRIPDEVRKTMTETWRRDQLSEKSRAALDAHLEANDSSEMSEKAFEKAAAGLIDELELDEFALTTTNVMNVKRKCGELPKEAKKLQEYADEAVAMTLDEDDRVGFRRGLLSFLPDLVDEKRFEEAHVLATCADQILDKEVPANAFMRDMIKRSLSR